jgi:hypothetical protein
VQNRHPLINQNNLPVFLCTLDGNGNGGPPESLNDLMSEGRLIRLTWQRMIGGFILLLIGLFLAFRGYRYYRFTMFLAGFITGCKSFCLFGSTMNKKNDGGGAFVFAEMEKIRVLCAIHRSIASYATNLSLSVFLY